MGIKGHCRESQVVSRESGRLGGGMGRGLPEGGGRLPTGQNG